MAAIGHFSGNRLHPIGVHYHYSSGESSILEVRLQNLKWKIAAENIGAMRAILLPTPQV